MKYMKEKEYMKIEIKRKDDGEIVFVVDNVEKKFEYDDFDCLIEMVYDNDDAIEYENEVEELKEYKNLINGIIVGARTQDYREAVAKAKASENALQAAENDEKIQGENTDD